MRDVVVIRIASIVAVIAFGLGVSAGCGSATPAEPKATTSPPILATVSPTAAASVGPPSTEPGDHRCVDPEAETRITGRDPEHFFQVSDLEGSVSNSSGAIQHITAIHLDFMPGIPPGVKTASLTVPVDLEVPVDGRMPWRWHGDVYVPPFHDDAPQPVPVDTDWTWTDPQQYADCPGF